MKKLRISVDGKVYDVTVQVLEDDEAIGSNSTHLSPAMPPLVRPAPPSAQAGQAPRLPSTQPNAILAPIAGTVQKVFVEPGSAVEPQAPVVLLDAMKMDTYIYAPRAMTVTEVSVRPGDAVQVGDSLIGFTPRE
jgi:glutaconyl-CoA/methylmalonyl-CoA decarboxylase subunit gamma